MTGLFLLSLCLTFANTNSFSLGLHHNWSPLSLILAQFLLIWCGGMAWSLRCSYSGALTFGRLFTGTRCNGWDRFLWFTIDLFLLIFILFWWSFTPFRAFILGFANWRFCHSSRSRPFGIHDFSLNFSWTFGFEKLQRLGCLFVIAKNQSFVCFAIAVLQLS